MCSNMGGGGGVGSDNSKDRGWVFPGTGRALQQAEEKLMKTKSERVVGSVFRFVQGIDNAITSSLAENDPFDNRAALLTYRRKARKLLQRIRSGEFSKI